nr:MAG TPA: hypothetical protein [Caudoviricetes sp.]
MTVSNTRRFLLCPKRDDVKKHRYSSRTLNGGI